MSQQQAEVGSFGLLPPEINDMIWRLVMTCPCNGKAHNANPIDVGVFMLFDRLPRQTRAGGICILLQEPHIPGQMPPPGSQDHVVVS